MVSIALVVVVGVWVAIAPVHAVETGLDAFGQETVLGGEDIRIIVARIIRGFIGLLGIVAVGTILFGGFMWMTSQGDETKITQAKRILINGAIGLVIILSAFAIAQFVLSRLVAAVGDSGGGSGIVGPSPLEDVSLTGALGSGPVADHYPSRDATGIPPNVRIFVTFRDTLEVTSFVADTNGNGTFAADGDRSLDLALAEAITVTRVGTDTSTSVGVTITEDLRTFILTPVELNDNGTVRATASGNAVRQWLQGDARNPQAYIVRLTNAFRSSDGKELFTGAFADGYSWSFTVSADADLTPPTITSVVPFPDSAQDGAQVTDRPDVARNVIVQVNFSEAMDPTVTSGTYRQSETTQRFTHLGVEYVTVQNTTVRLDGTFTIGNGYRTAEFTTFVSCGVNSCGGTVYCLPASAALTAWAEAAVLENPDDPTAVPFSGVMDAAGNSLSGDGDGVAEGPGTPRFDRHPDATNTNAFDSAQWTFFTNNAIDLTPPAIVSVEHTSRDDTALTYETNDTLADVQNVSPTAPIAFQFSKLMRSNATTAFFLEEALSGCDAEGSGDGCFWQYGRLEHVPAGAPIQSRVTIHHARLLEVPEVEPPLPQLPPAEYLVRVRSDAQDIYQNCFFNVGAPQKGPQGPKGGEACFTVGNIETCNVIP